MNAAPRFRRLGRVVGVAGLVVAIGSIGVGVWGFVRIHQWDTTVTSETCTVTAVGRPSLYGRSQLRWDVSTDDCGDLALTFGNPGYPFADGDALAARLASGGRFVLTLHGWGDRRDIVAAEPAP